MQVSIEETSGFCPGVIAAINKAESYLTTEGELFCLGDIVHNSEEIKRLEKMGLKSIKHADLEQMKYQKVLFRAHGEPPGSYQTTKTQNIEVIDATCTIVRSLQKKVAESCDLAQRENGSVIIYGKKNHPEVIGLNGQCNNNAIIIEDVDAVEKSDIKLPVWIFSQTTKSPLQYYEIVNAIKEKCNHQENVYVTDSICNWMKKRTDHLKHFAARHQLIIFAAGKRSSNGRFLYSLAKKVNPRTHFISKISEIKCNWFDNVESVGIAGATSTPKWLLNNIAEKIKNC